MNTNGFLDHELVSRRVKVGNEWQNRIFPIIGGRLRILHENNDSLSIQTEIVRLDADFAVVKAAVESRKGKFTGTGTSSVQRDARLADSLVELAETRAIARALRFGGIGVEYTGAEEVSHAVNAEPEQEPSGSKEPAPVFPTDDGNGKREAQASSGAPTDEGSKPKSGGNGTVTQAQCRALYALTKKANYQEADIGEMLARFDVSRFEDLTRESASQLIGQLQIQVAA